MSSGAKPPPPPESLDGLKFGQKIYFEDAAGTLAAAHQAKPKKGRGGGGGGAVHHAAAQPPRCQVEGCNADLSGAKAYYSRHKVCDKHSKSPCVVVAGLEQRFCQQCSRFHKLPEFDQGKRSCRRRLANHNERRRKPPPSSLLTSRYARVSSPYFDNNGRGGGFVMEFSPHPKLTLGNALSSELVPGNQIQTTTLPWEVNSQAPSDFFLQDSVGETSFLGPRHLPAESYGTEVTDSSCALSLLSNQTWGSKNTTPSVELNNFLNFNGTLMTQLAAASSQVAAGQLPNASWYFKGVDSGNCSPDEFVPDLGLGQISQPLHSHLSGELDVSQQGRRICMDLEKSRVIDSPHWSH